MQNEWRVIIEKPARGSWNMAVDNALLDAANEPGFIPTLRLFSWEPACLSLGHAQPISEVDQKSIESLNWGLVRRPTGGRAILHTDELTYSITGSTDLPLLQGGILASYQRISQALISFLEGYGLTPISKESGVGVAKNPEPVCFETPSNYEITVSGKKIIGSAQARKKNAVLQHGTIPISGDISRITNVLNYPDDSMRKKAAERVLTRATTIHAETGLMIPMEKVISDLILAFERTHQLNLVQGSLSHDEIRQAEILEKEKFASDSWTGRI